jgi:hypothetical protein
VRLKVGIHERNHPVRLDRFRPFGSSGLPVNWPVLGSITPEDPLSEDEPEEPEELVVAGGGGGGGGGGGKLLLLLLVDVVVEVVVEVSREVTVVVELLASVVVVVLEEAVPSVELDRDVELLRAVQL